MKFTVVYADSFDPKTIRSIPPAMQDAMKEAIESKLTTDPISFGKPLRYSLKGCRRLRVNDYRIVYTIKRKTVIILEIGHRSKIYSH